MLGSQICTALRSNLLDKVFGNRLVIDLDSIPDSYSHGGDFLVIALRFEHGKDLAPVDRARIRLGGCVLGNLGVLIKLSLGALFQDVLSELAIVVTLAAPEQGPVADPGRLDDLVSRLAGPYRLVHLRPADFFLVDSHQEPQTEKKAMISTRQIGHGASRG